MKLFTKEQLTKLLHNGSPEHIGKDHIPVVKLFTPDAGCTWLLTEIDLEETDLAFGLCDLGLGFPELSYISITELLSIRGRFGLPVERDSHFEGKHPISIYARSANMKSRIVTDCSFLDSIASKTMKV
ncbi:DUF2958 domain-containing protein [Spirosoma aerophilum]